MCELERDESRKWETYKDDDGWLRVMSLPIGWMMFTAVRDKFQSGNALSCCLPLWLIAILAHCKISPTCLDSHVAYSQQQQLVQDESFEAVCSIVKRCHFVHKFPPCSLHYRGGGKSAIQTAYTHECIIELQLYELGYTHRHEMWEGEEILLFSPLHCCTVKVLPLV